MSIFKIKDLAIEISDRVNDPKQSGYDRFVGLEHYDSGNVKIIRYGDASKMQSSAKAIQKGDVLIARRNVYLKRAGIVNFDGLTSEDSIVLRAKNEVIRSILPFIFNTDRFWKYANKFSDGSMSKRLSPKILMEYKVDLPDNDEDIIRLSCLLWSISDTLDSYKEMLKQCDELVKGQFVEMFGECKQINLSDLSEIIMGQSPNSKSYNDNSEGIPFFQGKIDFGDKYTNVTKWTTEPNKIVPKNTVLMSVRAPVGPVNIASVECCLGRGLCGIIANKDITNNIFIYNALKLQEEQIAEMGTGSTFNAITKNNVYNIKLPHASIEEYNQFSSLAEHLDKSKFAIKEAIGNLERIYKEIVREELK